MATLTIPDSLYERLQAAAANQRRTVDELLFEAIELVDPTTDAPEAKPMTREEEMQRLRRALSDDLEPADVELLPPDLRPQESPIDHFALRASMPVLDPPMSVTVINDRDERA